MSLLAHLGFFVLRLQDIPNVSKLEEQNVYLAVLGLFMFCCLQLMTNSTLCIPKAS